MNELKEEKRRLVKLVNREQMSWRAVDVEQLIDADHRARIIWELVGRLDRTQFYECIQSTKEEGGRPAYEPQLLISLWVYAYTLGIGSAREIERRCGWDPAFQWLTGLEVVNYHTLADFRVQRKEELDQLFTHLLAVLSQEGLVSLEQVTLDGTKIGANASQKSFRREKTLQEQVELARQRVKEMEADAEKGEVKQRMVRAQQRARREKQERLESALKELEKVREQKEGEKEKKEARASSSDPEARIMKLSDGGFAPSYNAQISTDTKHGMIVDVEVTQAGNDYGQLLPAVERIEERMQKKPQQMVVDGGFVSRENVEGMAEKAVDLLGALADDAAKAHRDGSRWGSEQFAYEAEEDRYRCPAGNYLEYEGKQQKDGQSYYKYKAKGAECRNCALRMQCCPENKKHGRSVVRSEESAAMVGFRKRMEREEAKAQYRVRGPVAEFRNCWIKSKLGLWTFHVRGLARAQAEALWVCLTHNLQHWMRLRPRSSVLASA
jgi:transposase